MKIRFYVNDSMIASRRNKTKQRRSCDSYVALRGFETDRASTALVPPPDYSEATFSGDATEKEVGGRRPESTRAFTFVSWTRSAE